MGTRVFVGGLTYRVRERDIEKFFRKYGRIKEVAMKNGFAFVVSTQLYFFIYRVIKHCSIRNSFVWNYGLQRGNFKNSYLLVFSKRYKNVKLGRTWQFEMPNLLLKQNFNFFTGKSFSNFISISLLSFLFQFVVLIVFAKSLNVIFCIKLNDFDFRNLMITEMQMTLSMN